jgi:hypothetical protein
VLTAPDALSPAPCLFCMLADAASAVSRPPSWKSCRQSGVTNDYLPSLVCLSSACVKAETRCRFLAPCLSICMVWHTCAWGSDTFWRLSLLLAGCSSMQVVGWSSSHRLVISISHKCCNDRNTVLFWFVGYHRSRWTGRGLSQCSCLSH